MADTTVCVRWAKENTYSGSIEFFRHAGNFTIFEKDQRYATLKAILDLLTIDELYADRPEKGWFIRWYNDLPEDMFDTALALEPNKQVVKKT